MVTKIIASNSSVVVPKRKRCTSVLTFSLNFNGQVRYFRLSKATILYKTLNDIGLHDNLKLESIFLLHYLGLLKYKKEGTVEMIHDLDIRSKKKMKNC